MLEYLQERIGTVYLRHNSTDKTVGADIRIVRGTHGVPWAVMGTKEGSQHGGTRDQCNGRKAVHDWVDALMDRLDAEASWRYE